MGDPGPLATRSFESDKKTTRQADETKFMIFLIFMLFAENSVNIH